MVASAMAGEGKTLTAANIAYTLSESFRRRTLLIDADLRRPTVDKVLNVMSVSGLNDALEAPDDRKLTIIEMSPRLSVLPAGRPNPDPMSGLTSPRMRSIVQEAATKFDWVVLDTPPIELLPDASLLSEMVDGVLLVVSAGITPFRSIERAVNAIDRKRILGVVLNRAVQGHASGYYGYAYAAGESPRA
jgi:capsular exopolysaccharide synthesis family protein